MLKFGWIRLAYSRFHTFWIGRFIGSPRAGICIVGADPLLYTHEWISYLCRDKVNDTERPWRDEHFCVRGSFGVDAGNCTDEE
jgi:hypothetical protein